MSWLQLSLQIDGDHAERVAAELDDLGAVAVTLEDAADTPLLEPAPGETPLWPSVIVTALFHPDRAGCLEALDTSDVWRLRSGFHLSLLAERAWEREWLKDFRPMRFGRHLWVCPADQVPDDDDRAVIIRLDPGLAFGTGTHPTTALCLEWLDAHPPNGATVTDFGCGSGILAIAAALLGAERVDALDIDVQALEATTANAKRNGVADRVHPRPAGGTIPDCNLLLANILADILIGLAAEFGAALRPGARVVLSGILVGQAAAVSAAYAPWFRLTDRAERDGWVLLAGIRREAD